MIFIPRPVLHIHAKYTMYSVCIHALYKYTYSCYNTFVLYNTIHMILRARTRCIIHWVDQPSDQ